MKALIGAFYQEQEALVIVRAYSVIVKSLFAPMMTLP